MQIESHEDLPRAVGRADGDVDQLRAALAELPRLRAAAEEAESLLVYAARTAGLTWADIGEQVGMTSDGASRWAARLTRPVGERVAASEKRGRRGGTAALLRAAWAQRGTVPEHAVDAVRIDHYQARPRAADGSVTDIRVDRRSVGAVRRDPWPSGRTAWRALPPDGAEGARSASRDAAVVELLLAAGIGVTDDPENSDRRTVGTNTDPA